MDGIKVTEQHAASIFRVEVTRSSEMLVPMYETTRQKTVTLTWLEELKILCLSFFLSVCPRASSLFVKNIFNLWIVGFTDFVQFVEQSTTIR
jgi:hypothetical protein